MELDEALATAAAWWAALPTGVGGASLVLFVVLAALCAGVVIWLYRASGALAALRSALADTVLEAAELERRLKALEEADPLGRLTALERRAATLVKDQEQLMLRDGATASYLQAIRHAQRGATVEELMSTHDLGQAEADLIMALYVREPGDSQRAAGATDAPPTEEPRR